MPADSGRQHQKRIAVQHVMRRFADSTSLHGVPRIIRARSFTARLFWSIICICAFSTFLFSCSNLLQQYFSYPKKVDVEIVQSPVAFPSVTVCNTGHLDMVVVDRIDKFFNDETPAEEEDNSMDEFFDKYTTFHSNSTSFFQHYPLHIHQRMKKDMIEISSRLGLVANIGPKLASAAGIRAEDFIISCQFLTKKCNVSQSFVKHFDSYYFNCFTFNPQSILASGTTQLSGVEYGLSLLLFAGAAGRLRPNEGSLVPGLTEFDPTLVSGQGARVVVHSPNTLPLPTTDGYDVPRGFSVTVGVRARENVRITEPHGSCSTDVGPNSKYSSTLILCQLECIQASIMQNCSCIDNRLPEIESNESLPYCLQLPVLDEECAVTDESEDMAAVNQSECVRIATELSERLACRKKIYDLVTIVEPGKIKLCNCNPPCQEIVYDAGYSLSSLPEPTGEHNNFYSEINNFLQSQLPKKKRELYQKLNMTSNKMISRLNVYIADSNIIKTTESPDYELIRLVSDIGGQLGLWIGISVFTLVEVVQLFSDLLRKLAGSVTSSDGNGDVDNKTTDGHREDGDVNYHQASNEEDSDDGGDSSPKIIHGMNGSGESRPVDEMTSVV